jgi:hypothetical protein
LAAKPITKGFASAPADGFIDPLLGSKRSANLIYCIGLLLAYETMH